MSKITVGQHVWYRPGAHEAGPYPGTQPLAAIVTHVNQDGRLNLFVFGMDASTHALKNIDYEDGNERPEKPGYAEPVETPTKSAFRRKAAAKNGPKGMK